MTAEQIISAIGLIGIGGLIKSLIDFLISSKEAKLNAKNDMKEIRYKSIILMAYSLINYDSEGATLIINRPDIRTKDRLQKELNVEFFNMALFASDSVIQKMKEFLIAQNKDGLNNLAIAMRKDLYGIRTNLKNTFFELP